MFPDSTLVSSGLVGLVFFVLLLFHQVSSTDFNLSGVCLRGSVCFCLVVCEIFRRNTAIVSKEWCHKNMDLGHAKLLEMFSVKVFDSLGPGT